MSTITTVRLRRSEKSRPTIDVKLRRFVHDKILCLTSFTLACNVIRVAASQHLSFLELKELCNYRTVIRNSLLNLFWLLHKTEKNKKAKKIKIKSRVGWCIVSRGNHIPLLDCIQFHVTLQRH